MRVVTGTYKILVEDDPLTVKTAARLEPGRALEIKRIADREDTFEIGIYTDKDVLLGLLDYRQSVGIAPFIDSGEVTARAWVGKAELKKGASRAGDKTELTIWVEYTYDEETLTEFSGGEYFGLLPADDRLMAAFIAHVLAGAGDIVMDREYLNYFSCNIILQGRVKDMFEGAGRLACGVLTDEKFTKCKIIAKIYDKDNKEQNIELTRGEKETALTFVNHALIFSGADGIDPVIEE